MSLLDNAGRIASNDDIRWKRFGDDGPCAHGDALTQLDARENDGVGPDPTIFADADRFSRGPRMTQISGIVVRADDAHARAKHDPIPKFNAVGGLDVTADAPRKAHGDVLPHRDSLRKHDARGEVHGDLAGAIHAKDALYEEVGDEEAWSWDKAPVSQASRQAGDAGKWSKQAK